MTNTFRSQAEKANEFLKQLQAITHNLEYYLDKTTPEREWLIRGALYFLEHLIKDIYDKEMVGAAPMGGKHD